MELSNPSSQRETDLHYYWRQIRKRPWLIIASLLVSAVASAMLSARTRPLYQATASLLIEQDASKVVPFEQLTPNDQASGYYQTQHKILQSRSLARRVIEALNLQEHPEFAPGESVPTLWHTVMGWIRARLASLLDRGEEHLETVDTGPPLDPQSGLIDAFLRRLTVKSVRDIHIINISFLAHDPHLAATAANTLARLYVDLNLELRFASLQDGIEWLNKRVPNLRREVETGELKMEQYKKAHDVYSIDDRLPGIMQEIEQANNALLEARTERIRLETLYNTILSASRNPETQAGLLSDRSRPHIETLKASYAELQDQAVQWGTKVTERHPKLIELRAQLDEVKEKINWEVEKEIQQLIQAARSNVEVAKARETAQVAKISTLKGEARQINTRVIGDNQLKREAENSKRMADMLMTHLKEMNLSTEVKSGDNVRIIDPAEIPQGPINIHPLRNFLGASIVGLIIGVGLVVFRDYLDRTLKTTAEVEQCLGLPVVGAISRFRRRRTGRSDVPYTLPTIRSPRSREAEAFKMLRTHLLFRNTDPPRKVFLVTSPHPNDGKTTVAGNLAMVMGQMDRRVLLVEADLRHPSIHELFSIEQRADWVGLSQLLLTEKYADTLEEFDQNITIVTAGELPPNPAELLGSKRMQRFMEYARAHYDIVIIDTPPILAVSDSLMLRTLVDSVLLVLRAGSTTWNHARRAVAHFMAIQPQDPFNTGSEQETSSRGHGLEIVLNFLDPREEDSYGYYGYHNYYSDERGEPSDKWISQLLLLRSQYERGEPSDKG
jgi:capsular exopolysaccharide synthesis family protein